MAHPEYEHIGHPLEILAEECCELGKAALKAKRFGFDNFNPFDNKKEKNIHKIIREFNDVKRSFERAMVLYSKEKGVNGEVKIR